MASSRTQPHFFKIILPHILDQQMLEVPIKFVKKNGEILEGEEVWLKVVNGEKRKIGLKKSNKKIWLEKGWDEFVKFYSIENGHFVVFKYESNFCFQVLIFDKTATEIEYPNKKMSENERSKNKKESCQVLPKRMKRRNEAADDANNTIVDQLKNINLEDMQSSELMIFENASKFQAQITNPSFKIKLKPTHLHPRTCYANIPKLFGNTYLKNVKDFNVRVSADEKVWKILCAERWYKGIQRFEIKRGWRAFSKDNSLKEGDICIFELLQNTRITSFKATIFRVDM